MGEGTGKSASRKVINFTKTSKKWPWESKLGELHAQRTSPNYWAACAPSHKMGFRSSAAKNGLPGEGRHDGLVPRNDVLTNGFV